MQWIHQYCMQCVNQSARIRSLKITGVPIKMHLSLKVQVSPSAGPLQVLGLSRCLPFPSVGSLKVLGPSKCGSLLTVFASLHHPTVIKHYLKVTLTLIVSLTFHHVKIKLQLLSLNLALTLTVFASLYHPTVIKHYLKVTLTLIVSLTFHHVKIKLQLLSLNWALTLTVFASLHHQKVIKHYL